jgi:hypothetical protein
MKKLLMLLAAGVFLMLIFGCSDAPDVNRPSDAPSITLVQRPEFVELRPDAVVSQFVLKTDHAASFEKKPPPPPPDPGGDDPNPNPAHKYAYIVGISDYDGTANDLQFPDDDAMAMRSYFQSQGFTCRMDLNRNATADAITAGLEWLISSAVPGDEIAFSYSGHGAKAPGYGSSIISTDLYYVTHGYVMSYFNAVNCSKKLGALDACQIGDFLNDAVSGTVMATASTSCYSYDAPDLGHGAWTYFFLEGAEDLNLVFAEDCASHAESGMRAWAKIYHLRVCPSHKDMYDGSFDM